MCVFFELFNTLALIQSSFNITSSRGCGAAVENAGNIPESPPLGHIYD